MPPTDIASIIQGFSRWIIVFLKPLKILFGVNELEFAEETKDAILSLVITQPGYWEKYRVNMEKKDLKDLNTPHLRARAIGPCELEDRGCAHH